MLRVQLLGKTALNWDGHPLEHHLSGKSIPLLYLLLQSETHFLTRDKLACYLWPDSAAEAAKYNLRYTLWQLKKALPLCGEETFVVTKKGGCQLNSQYPWQCDLVDIKHSSITSSANQELLRLSQLFRGEVMEGWYLKNCGEFNDLILMDRMLCERRQVELLRLLAGRYQDEGNYQLCLDTLHKITAVEPNNEDIARFIMDTYIRLGDRVGAIRYYNQFACTLWNDLQLSPNESLQELYSKLKGGQSSQPEVSPGRLPNELVITAQGLPQVQGSLVAEVIEGLLEQLGPAQFLGIELPYIQDLRWLSSALEAVYGAHAGVPLPPSPGHVPDVRIVGSFRALVRFICAHSKRHLRLVCCGEADPLSAAALESVGAMKEITVKSRPPQFVHNIN